MTSFEIKKQINAKSIEEALKKESQSKIIAIYEIKDQVKKTTGTKEIRIKGFEV